MALDVVPSFQFYDAVSQAALRQVRCLKKRVALIVLDSVTIDIFLINY